MIDAKTDNRQPRIGHKGLDLYDNTTQTSTHVNKM